MNPLLIKVLCGLAFGGLALVSMLILLKSLRLQQTKDPKPDREKLIGFLRKYVIPFDVIMFALVGFFYISPIFVDNFGAN